jgi:hypothetical protein
MRDYTKQEKAKIIWPGTAACELEIIGRQRSSVHHPAKAAAAPWPRPTARASKRCVLHRWPGSGHGLRVDRLDDPVRRRRQEAATTNDGQHPSSSCRPVRCGHCAPVARCQTAAAAASFSICFEVGMRPLAGRLEHIKNNGVESAEGRSRKNDPDDGSSGVGTKVARSS